MKDNDIAVDNSIAANSAASAEMGPLASLLAPEYPEYQGSVALAKEIFEAAPARTNIPIRRAFVRNGDGGSPAPLAEIVSRGGRGGAVAAKLYVALIWRCSAKPFNTSIAPRKWAALLGLSDPDRKGARRITNALNLLEDLKLVKLTRSRGDSSLITLLDESGDGSKYLPPSEASMIGGKERDRYFKMPVTLWTDHRAYAQRMSSGALVMLFLLLDSGSGVPTTLAEGTEQWWSVEIFQKWYAVSGPMRTRGTKELIEMGLLYVRKEAVPSYKGQGSFAKERVRNVYRLQNAALIRSNKSLDRPDLPDATTFAEKIAQLPNSMRSRPS
ncbi:hypothetical protein AARI_pII00020 (plasmid) [Glutamicibacter arilaitensis Re117]|uniref:Uncharacterized protein n=1 Tax=Glutamicibacter arilaitensis (strain DSM 16368 / CIP 108037 / IAM 15318 / JCM 13566 / NCIMB 14258 / Re117) TaxID=861360 RepID=A0ABM9PSR9_GLUAR|nr:hypothetical protein [Glutamicibacter arilaitensis]CBQ74089.1 hypothetical protein AARI_pII00020 [Glutamicibacter arilaitensis Re117]